MKTNKEGDIPQPYALAHDSEMRLLLAFTAPPRAGRIAAVNAASYTVEIADGDNATVEAVALNGFVYAAGNVVYVLQADNAPDSGVIVGRKGAARRLGVGVADPDAALQVEDSVGGGGILTAGAIAGTEQTLLSGRVGRAFAGRALLASGAAYITADVELGVPGSGYAAQNAAIASTTVQFRLYANGDLRVVRTAGTGTPDAALRAVWL